MKRHLRVLFTGLLLLESVAAFGVETDNSNKAAPTGLEEIVVTATHREERTKDIPISISVVTNQQTESLGIASSEALSLLTPGLTFGSQVLYGQPYIRGIGSSLTSLGTESSIALYIDGVYQARQSSLLQDLSNIDRIEVLKGPQGTLYGRNATGGAINIVTKQPEAGFVANGEVGGGNYDTKIGKMYVSGGSESISTSVSGYVRKHDGYYTNFLTGNRVEDVDNYGGMWKIYWRINGRNTLTLAFDASNTQGAYGAFASQFGNDNVTAAVFPGAQWTSAPRGTYADQESRVAGSNWQRSRGASARWATSFDSFDLNVVAGLRGLRLRSSIDVDASSAPIILFADLPPRGSKTPEQFNMWSVEPTLTSKGNGPFSWTVGGLAYRDGGHLNTVIDVLNQFAQDTGDSSFGMAYAGYAEGSYKFGDDRRWKATAGVRYSNEKKELYNVSQFVYLGGYEAGAPTPVVGFPNDSRSWHDVTGSASLSYDFGSANVYARWAQGFKSGAYALNDIVAPPVNPEKINSGEIGAKSLLANGTLELSGAVFYYDYSNIQVQSINSETGGTTLENAASAKVKGLEGNLRALINENFQVTLGLSYLDAYYSSFPRATVTVPCSSLGIPAPQNCVPGTAPAAAIAPPDLTGSSLPYAPRFGENASVNYAVPVPIGKIELAAAASHSGRYFFDPNNRLFQHPYTLVNASVTLRAQNHWYVRLWSNNLTNHDYLSYVSPVQFGDFAHWADPRTYGLSLGYNYQ